MNAREKADAALAAARRASDGLRYAEGTLRAAKDGVTSAKRHADEMWAEADTAEDAAVAAGFPDRRKQDPV